MFRYSIFKFGQFLIDHLSESTAYKFANVLSNLHYIFSKTDRRAVRNNLKKIIAQEKNLSFLTKEVFINFGRYIVEFFQIRKNITQNFLKTKVQLYGVEHIDHVLKKGNGGIVITAHIGNWELGAIFLSMLGYPVTAVALPHREQKVNDFFNDQRKIKGVEVIQSNEAVQECVDALKNNKLIALVADRDFSLKGEVVDFLGEKTLIPKGPAIFSQKTGAPIIPVFLIRQKDNTFCLTVCAPIYSEGFYEKKLGQKDIVKCIMRQYITIIENKIRQYPAQWLMFREFWKKD